MCALTKKDGPLYNAESGNDAVNKNGEESSLLTVTGPANGGSATAPPVSNWARKKWRKQYGRFVAQETGTRFESQTTQYQEKSAEKYTPPRRSITESDIIVSRQQFGVKVLNLCLSFSSLPKEEQERLLRMASEYDPMTGEVVR